MTTLRTIFAAAALAAFSSLAAAQGSIELKATALVESEVTDPDGTVRKTVEPASTVLPGTEVIYRISFTNVGTQTATGLVINDPVPESTVYVAGSAFGTNTTPLVSVDGGNDFGQLEELEVLEDDGTLRPAAGKDVTHVRWLVNYPLEPQQSGSVTFRATLQ